MSAVGDAVHVLPVLTALKPHRPMHITWVLQPGAGDARARPPCGGRDPRVRSLGGLARLHRHAAAARRVASSTSCSTPGLLQGRARDVVHARAGEARIRPCAGARRNWLFTTHRIPPHACSTCRISTSNSSRARRAARAGLGSRPVARGAGMAARVRRAVRSSHRADRRGDEQAGEGLAAGALGRGGRRAVA